MLLKIKENSIDPIELNNVLSEEFKGKYKITTRTKAVIVVAKDNIIGALVTVSKKKIYVVGNFSTLKVQLIAMLLMIFLGIIIPLIIYYFIFHKKMKLVEKEVGEFIGENYREEVLE